MRSNDGHDDDLTAIKGIGPSRQQWFREAFAVHTFPDLSVLSVDEIQTQLKAEGGIVSRDEIEGWVVQARELAAAELPSRTAVEPASTEAGVTVNSPPQESGWQPFASFVVEFQALGLEEQVRERRTVAHHIEADRSRTWPDIEGDRLCQWMLDQISEEVQRMPRSESSVESPPPVAPATTVEIAQIRAFQPPRAGVPIGLSEAGRPFLGIVKGDEPFALEVCFKLTGATAAQAAQEQATYIAQLCAYNLATGATVDLGDTGTHTLTEGWLSYTAVLPEATLPLGMYRLRILVMIQGALAFPGYLEVPMLQVV